MILQTLLTKFGFSVEHAPLDKLNHTLESMHGKLEFLAAAEIVRGVWELAERFAGMGEQLETAAVSAGITAEEFQKLAYAASQNAVGQDELSGALARMSRKLQAAKDGSQQAAESFAKLGIDGEQLKGMKNSRDAFYAVADAIGRVDDQQKRLALTQEFFGRGSAKLLKFIQKGSTEYERLGREAEVMGAILGDKGVEDLANFEDAFSGLLLTVKITMAQIGASFAPMFTHIIKDIEKFWGENQKLIKTDIKGWAAKAAYAFGFMYGAIQITVQAFADFVKEHPKLSRNIAMVTAGLMAFSLAVGTVKFLLTGVTDTIKTLQGVFSIGTPIAKFFFWTLRWGAILSLRACALLAEKLGWFLYEWFPGIGKAIVLFGIRLAGLAVNPTVLAIAGVVAGIATIVLLLQAAWAMLHGKSFKETWLGQLIDGVASFTGGAIGWLKEKLGFKTKSGYSVDPMRPDIEGPPLPDSMAAAAAGLGLLPTVGTGALQGLAATGASLDPSGMTLPPPIRAAEQVLNVSLSAPITINGVKDAVQAQDDIRNSIKEAMNQSAREIQRNTASAALR